MEKNQLKSSPKSAWRTGRILLRIGFGFAMAGLLFIHPAQRASAINGCGQQVCITDTATGDNIVFNITSMNAGANTAGGCAALNVATGNYTYTQCSTGFQLTGTGMVTTPSGVMTPTDKRADRSVKAGLLPQGTGKFVIYFQQPSPNGVWRVFGGNQTIPFQMCGCPRG